MEETIEKVSALGATNYLPIEMERCNAKFHDDKIEKKMLRLNKIAKEACEQSHRTNLLKVENPNVSFLVNSAGFGRFGNYQEVDCDVSLKMIDLNCKSLVLFTLHSMRKHPPMMRYIEYKFQNKKSHTPMERGYCYKL